MAKRCVTPGLGQVFSGAAKIGQVLTHLLKVRGREEMKAMRVALRLAGRFNGRCGVCLLLVAMFFLCVAVLSGARPALAAPHVDSYSPSEVNAGAMVDINGRDFGRVVGPHDRVKYGTNGSPTGEIALGDILSWTDTRIRVRLPGTMPAGVYWLAIYGLDLRGNPLLMSNQLRGLTVRVPVIRPTPGPVASVPFWPLVTRPPARTGTTHQLVYAANHPAYCLPRTRSTAPTISDPGAGSVMVGYTNFYDPGTEPFPCYESIIHLFRGMVLFDLSDLRGRTIERAELSFRTSQAPIAHRTPSCIESNPFDLYTLSRDWAAGFRDGHIPYGATAGVMGAASAGGYTRDLTGLVRQWVGGSLPNYGLVLVGRGEGAQVANAACVTRASGFSLRVDYR